MLRTLLRQSLQKCVRLIPVSLRDRLLVHLAENASEPAKFRLGVPTTAGLLQHLARNGFAPRTVIDIGAYVGDWGRMAAAAFPAAKLYMIDGNPENEKALQEIRQQLGANAHAEILLLGPERRDSVTFFRMATGSSVLEELTTLDRTRVELQMTTLDKAFEERPLEEPVLLKLDVQGFELEVLRGGSRVLAAAEVVVLETSLLPFNKNAPLFSEVFAFMDDAGYFVYDFCGQSRRQTDQVLFQTDVVFVRPESKLRAPRKFWLNEP